MSTKFTKTTRVTGLALAIASGAMVVLGIAPASAASVQYDIELRSHSMPQPSWGAAEAETRPAADQRCVATYGLRARGVTAVSYHGGGSAATGYTWKMTWRCDSN